MIDGGIEILSTFADGIAETGGETSEVNDQDLFAGVLPLFLLVLIGYSLGKMAMRK